MAQRAGRVTLLDQQAGEHAMNLCQAGTRLACQEGLTHPDGFCHVPGGLPPIHAPDHFGRRWRGEPVGHTLTRIATTAEQHHGQNQRCGFESSPQGKRGMDRGEQKHGFVLIDFINFIIYLSF
jgi:hypothetical protein